MKNKSLQVPLLHQQQGDVSNLLVEYARRYETAEFLQGDPSWFMHQVCGIANQEDMAFIASVLSYGSRKQFLPKIQQILDWSNGEVHQWILSREYHTRFRQDDNSAFYRLYSHALMGRFFDAYEKLLSRHSTLGNFVQQHATDASQALEVICRYFSSFDVSPIIPHDSRSACKRLCMFMRWMVRSNSPVDLGLWSQFIDCRSLIIPLDTHVLAQAKRLGLLKSQSPSMHTAIQLTQTLKEIFPHDPLLGDFALFGYGVNH